MPRLRAQPRFKLVKATHPSRPKSKYFMLMPSPKALAQLSKHIIVVKSCDRPCTATISLLPKITIPAHSGIGFPMINVDGFRWINAYVIGDALTSSNQRGFSLELSFSLNPFVPGVGVVGETNVFFDFSGYYDPGSVSHKLIRCQTSDLLSTGGLPKIGGIDQTQILRVPVLGPFVRASAFNEDGTDHKAEVRAYLST